MSLFRYDFAPAGSSDNMAGKAGTKTRNKRQSKHAREIEEKRRKH